jgi:ATP-binding cassette, subfamily B, bacterial MsbA
LNKPDTTQLIQSIGTAWQAMSSLTLGLLPAWTGSTPVARLIRHTARAQKRLLTLNIAFALLLSISEAGLFALIYRTVRVLAGSPLPLILKQSGLDRGAVFLILLLGVTSLQLMASFCRGMNGILAGRFAARCETEIMPMVHQHILNLSYSCASSFKIGDLARRASIAPMAINAEIEHASHIITDGLLACVYFIVLVLISPWLMLLACGLAIGMAITQSYLSPRIRRASKEVERKRSHIASAITADLQVLKLLHSSASTDEANQRFQGQLHGLEPELRRLSTLRSFLEPIAELLPLFTAVLLGVLSWQLTKGRSDLLIPSLATFVLALQRLNIRLLKIGQSANILSENLSRIELVNDLLNPADKDFRRRGGQSFQGLRREIRFHEVTLHYPERTTASLIEASFTLPRNSTVALVGASGAGKSTIVDLLVGLIDPSSGQILVDGLDLRDLDLDSWQRHLGVVSQDVLVVNDTIAANIAYGMGGDISMPAIHRASMAACAHEFISQLPDGYDTMIGEQGHRLSGGQRQRLSLALDSHTEALVHQAVEAFISGRTVLAVAHRLSSIRDAKLILVVEAGRIVERGSHDELLLAGGHYARLWNRQQHPKTAAPPIRP